MTSMPASRSARAITLAPRSCPSRPGLATSTRIGFVITFIPGQMAGSDRARFLMGAEYVPQSVTDFAQRCVGADGIQNVRHSVVRSIVRTLGRAPEAVQRSGDLRPIPPLPQRRQFGYLAFVRCLIDL